MVPMAPSSTWTRPSSSSFRSVTSLTLPPSPFPPSRNSKPVAARKPQRAGLLADCFTWPQYAANHHGIGCNPESRATRPSRNPYLFTPHIGARRDARRAASSNRALRDRLALHGRGAALRFPDGLGGTVSLYQAADRGGDLVYAYAGGVGIRSGDPADVDRLLVAGLYHEAMLERKQGKPGEAAQLIGQLAQRYPEDTAVRLLAVESLIVDKQDGKAALTALKQFAPGSDSRFLRFRVGLLRADAFAAAGMPDSARIVLRAMAAEFANNRARGPGAGWRARIRRGARARPVPRRQ